MTQNVTLVTVVPSTGGNRIETPIGTAANPMVTGAATTSPGGAAANPSFTRSVGGSTLATGQVANSVSPAAAIQIVPARAGRQSVTITNITGTQPFYIVASAVTTGVTTGLFVASAAGASITIATASAVFSTSPTAAQTLSFMENY